MKLHIENKETTELLMESITSDVLQFLDYWKRSNIQDPEHYPAELDSDAWMEQFWAWMEGR